MGRLPRLDSSCINMSRGPTTRAERALYLGGLPGVGSRFLEPERKTTMLLGPYDDLQARCLEMTDELRQLKAENESLKRGNSDSEVLINHLKKESDLQMGLVAREQQEAMGAKRAGEAAADDAWELRLSLEAKDATIADLTRKNEELEDQLVGLHAMMEEFKSHPEGVAGN